MAAFERILSGIPDMDITLDNIRLGDNVVWQVTNLDEFKVFLKPYVNQAIKDKRNIVYIRFASHEALLEEQDGLKIIHIELSHRFETFTVEIHHLIEEQGRDAFYVFDCLSELQTAWSTDLMMGNFFKVTCPFLFKMDTVAYFPLIRGKHSFKAIANIRDTSQLLLDVYSDSSCIYLRPLKVWNRYSESMFLPHCYNKAGNTLKPLTDGVKISRFYQLMNIEQSSSDNLNIDSWDRFFSSTEQNFRQGFDVSEQCGRICNIMMSRDEKIRKLIKANFTPEDYFQVRSRMIGTGMIGGKACGMLLARKLIENKNPNLYKKLEPHDSYYIGSDVFYSYIVYNNYWDIRVRQRTKEEYFSLADEFAKALRSGKFSDTQREEFCRMLDYYGQNPIIVRSSSILEDGFGNAFAGKYESVFCINKGSLEQRLEEFETAVRTVYASSMSKSALDYRLRRGLESRDEQMALLVQRVSGSRYKDLFMPCAAGVGYSYSPYRFSDKTDPNMGMLRLVMGLGTAAVDRTEGSYPRLINLDKPKMTPPSNGKDKNRFSQRKIDLINLSSASLESKETSWLENKIPAYLKKALLEHDYEAERFFSEMGKKRDIFYISCHGLVNNSELMNDMKDMMLLIQQQYQYPVDIEYTINLSENGDYVINLLQCRPLQVADDKKEIKIPEISDKEKIFLECHNASMGLSEAIKMDYIVMVNPVEYYNMKYNDKYKIAKILGELNWHFRSAGKHLMLLVPGRICTSSPELGVPTAFSEISSFDMICEISESRVGYMPELSYGSHIFQDMVEGKILYSAVFENEKTPIFKPEKITNLQNIITKYSSMGDELKNIIGLYNVSEKDCFVYHDMKAEHLLCIIG